MRHITFAALLLFLLTCLLTACGADNYSYALPQPEMFARGEITFIDPLSQQSTKTIMIPPADAQRLYRSIQTFPALPEGKICDQQIRTSYQLTFISSEEHTLYAVVDQSDCGTAALLQGDTSVRLPDTSFWTYFRQLTSSNRT